MAVKLSSLNATAQISFPRRSQKHLGLRLTSGGKESWGGGGSQEEGARIKAES